MKKAPIDLIETLKKTNRCRPDVAGTAEIFKEFTPGQHDNLLRRLINAGDEKTLGMLLIICGVNKVLLDPTLLAGALKVVEELEDFALAYTVQDLRAVEPLLHIARSREISSEEQVFAGRLAAELTARLDGDRTRVKKVLRRMGSTLVEPELMMLNELSLSLLRPDFKDSAGFPWVTKKDVIKTLPREKPPVVIGGSFTVRRPVPKIGRNAPCHCGSGKKYKKCCYDKDRTLLRDASPYEGVTMTQARSTPELVDGAEMISEMKATELKKLTPSKLNDEQLFAAYHRADLFRLNDVAFLMLLELQARRPPNEGIITFYLKKLLSSALHDMDLDLSRLIRDSISSDALPDDDPLLFHMELVKNRGNFDGLEKQCKAALAADEDELRYDDPLIALGHDCENLFPSLSIVFSRAAICGNPDRVLDNESLLDVIRGARADLGLDPWSDPMEDYFQWTLEKLETDSEREEVSKEIEDLRQKTSEANRQAAEKASQLRKKERELAALLRRKENAEKAAPDPAAPPLSAREMSDDGRGAVNDLRRRIDGLKSEIRAQQQARRQLREQLREERKKTRLLEKDKKREETPAKSEDSIPLERAPRKILIPEFTDAFRRGCETMPPGVVAKALRAATGFAVNDQSIWRRTKRIDKVPHLFRIKIDPRHRLMIHSEKDVRIQALDLIHRENLTTWIKQRTV